MTIETQILPSHGLSSVTSFMPIAPAALIWPVLGWALLAGAAAALLWCLIGNIRRWRRKPARVCPRCAYDLSHSPGMTCSECGFAAVSESQLRRWRPRWCLALLALALLPLSSLAFRAPGIAERGWVAAIPTTVLILLSDPFEYTETGTWEKYKKKSHSGTPARRRLGGELLHERVRTGQTWRWQRDWFASRIIDRIEWNGIAYPGDASVRRGGRNSPPERILQDLVTFSEVDWSPVMCPLRDRIAREMVSVWTSGRTGKSHIGLNDSRWMFGVHWSELRVYLNDSPRETNRRSRGPSGVG